MTDDTQFANLIANVEKHIHRIDIYIRCVLYYPLLQQLKERYRYLGTYSKKNPGKVATSSRFNICGDGSVEDFSINQIDSQRDRSYCYISIINHTSEFRNDLVSIIISEISKYQFLSSTHPHYACSVQYVESALDFYPHDVRDLDRIFIYLVEGLFFKYARRGENFVYQCGKQPNIGNHKCPTFYIGKRKIKGCKSGRANWDIDVRNRLHGLRVYYRPKETRPEYIRFEYVAHKIRLSSLGLRGIYSLPDIAPNLIRPLDYALYRKKSQHDMAKYLIKKYPAKVRPKSLLGVRTKIDAHKSELWHGLNYVPRSSMDDPEEWRVMQNNRIEREPQEYMETVACVDAYKEITEKLKHKYKIGSFYPVDRFYPKDETKLSSLKAMVSYP